METEIIYSVQFDWNHKEDVCKVLGAGGGDGQENNLLPLGFSRWKMMWGKPLLRISNTPYSPLFLYSPRMFASAARTKWYTGWFKQQKLIPSQFWRLEIQEHGGFTGWVPSEEYEGESVPCLSPSFWVFAGHLKPFEESKTSTLLCSTLVCFSSCIVLSINLLILVIVFP